MVTASVSQQLRRRPPLQVNGRALTARQVGARDWLSASAAARPDALSHPERAALAAAWTADGLFEHASVASFAQLSLALMGAGAPSALIEAAHRAALDEIEHARACFALASAYGGAAVGPSALALPSTLTLVRELGALAEAAAREGCIGETVAAGLAAQQLAVATDPAVIEVLSAIAEQEAQHAELSWRIVAWAVRVGGEPVRAQVARVFDDPTGHLPAPAAELAAERGHARPRPPRRGDPPARRRGPAARRRAPQRARPARALARVARLVRGCLKRPPAARRALRPPRPPRPPRRALAPPPRPPPAPPRAPPRRGALLRALPRFPARRARALSQSTPRPRPALPAPQVPWTRPPLRLRCAPRAHPLLASSRRSSSSRGDRASSTRSRSRSCSATSSAPPRTP